MSGSPLRDPRITALGLLIEAHDGLQRRLACLLAKVGLPKAEFEALLRLARSDNERLRLNDLATQLDLSVSGASRLVDRLVRRGLVRREACTTDRRGFHAVITDAGRALIDDSIAEHVALIDQWYTGILDPEELETLTALLRKVRDVVHPGAEAGSHDAETAMSDSSSGAR